MKRQAFNPYLPGGEYVPDGEPHVFGDRIYIYGSHDRFGGTAYCENDYVSWSASLNDLSDWKYEGVIYRKTQDPMNPDGALQLWAPDIMQGKDGRYYLYYCFSFYPAIGVAVCDTPCGSFEFYGHVKYEDGTPYGMAEGDVMPFDPGVLNDNGRYFVYSNFSQELIRMLPAELGDAVRNGDMTEDEVFAQMAPDAGGSLRRMNLCGEGSKVIELKEDMLTVKTVKSLIPGISNSEGTGFEGHEFYEASSIRKIGEKYYFIYSSYLSHELAYAVSDCPDEGFSFGGPVISNGDIGYQGREMQDALNYFGNNHGSLVEVNGQWYVFYHRQTNCNEQTRQGCAEPITIAPDGSIAQVEMTSCGLNGAPLKSEGTYPAYIACNLFGKNGACKYDVSNEEASARLKKDNPYITQDEEDIEVPVYEKQVQYIRNMQDGSTAGFKYFDMVNISEISAVIRGGAGVLRISDAPNGEVAGETSFAASEDWQTVRIPVKMADGRKALYFMYEGDAAIDFKEFSF